MPYKIVKKKGDKPYKIVKADTGEVVGSSTSKAKAARSIGYREEAKKEKPAGMSAFPRAHMIKNERVPAQRPMKVITAKQMMENKSRKK